MAVVYSMPNDAKWYSDLEMELMSKVIGKN